MRYSRVFPLALLVGGAAFLIHSAAQQPVPPAKSSGIPPVTQSQPKANPQAKPATPPAAEPIKSDPEAQRALDEAIKSLESKPIQWFQADLWQQLEVQGLIVRCDGPFLYGPNYKLHMDLNVRTGAAVNRLEIRCDGATRWEIRQLNDSRKEVQRLDWGKVAKTLNQPNVHSDDRENFLSSQSFSGLLPLLKTLRQDLALTKLEKVEWNERPALKLTGVWTSEIIRNPIPANAWPGALPRECSLYLDSRTSLPMRLEWWGPSYQGGRDSLLLQLELRNPKINVELTPERVAQVFKYTPPPDTPVQDVTDGLIRGIQAQLEQKRAQPRMQPKQPPG